MTAHRPTTLGRHALEALESREVPSITGGPWYWSANTPGDPTLMSSVQVVSPLAESADGRQVTVSVKDVVAGDAPVTVNLMVYTRAAQDLDPYPSINFQKLYAFDTKVLSTLDQIVTLTVNLPSCTRYQADVALGTLTPNVLASKVFPDNVISAAYGDAICTPPVTGFNPHTQGYWKNHVEAWPVGSLTLGGITYNQEQLLKIFNTPVKGNGAIALAHQLIAAKLNVASGADATGISGAISQADAMLGGVNLLNGGKLSTSQTSYLVGQLDAFNNS